MKKYLFVWLVFNLFTSFAQERRIGGQILDTTNSPVVYANIMAEVLNDVNIPPVFAMTGENGKYSISLLNKYAYQLTVLSMGYEKYIFVVDSLSGSIEKNIILHPAKNQLEEVIVTADIPVKITQDSIVYKTDKFKTGEERKLKDILKKLPGVEVNKSGQVTVMGKKVSKVLVEGKEFLGGGSKLAVENIPADAVDKVTAVDDYNSVSFMSGLTDEQKMIINIKLKEGKKHFVFGDIFAGGGNDKKYSAKANLFYYSPKTNFSYIGNLNNSGEAPMEISDFMRFEGNVMDFDKIRSSIQSFNNISSIIFQDRFVSKKNHFQALQWQQDFGKKTEFNSYFIFSRDRQTAKEKINREYLVPDIVEDRTTADKQFLKTVIGKIHWRRKSSIFNYLDLEILSNWQRQDAFSNIETKYNQDLYELDKTIYKENYKITANVAWHKRFNKRNIFRLLNNLTISRYTPSNFWVSNQPVMNNLLPIQNDVVYQIYQNYERKTKQWYIELKYYWLINNKQHIYTSFGNQFSDKNLLSNTFQKDTNGENYSFKAVGFNNDFKLKFNDFFASLQYKVKWGKIIAKTGFFAHRYTWYISHTQDREKINILPEFKIEKKYSFAKKISFTYSLNSSVPDILKYVDRFYLNDFSSVSKGNSDIENELYHRFSFVLNNYSFANKHQYYIRLTYNKKLNPVKNKIVYDDIYAYRETDQIQLSDHSFNAKLFYKLDLKKLYIKFRPFFQYSQTNQNIQGGWKQIDNFNQNYNFELGSYFKDFPNFIIGSTFSLFHTSFGTSNTKSEKFVPFIKIDYDFLKNFVFKARYEYTMLYDNQENRTDYQTAGFTFSYQKENSPWGFELTGNNLFSTPFIEQINYGPYIITRQKTFQQTFVLMLRLHYKI